MNSGHRQYRSIVGLPSDIRTAVAEILDWELSRKFPNKDRKSVSVTAKALVEGRNYLTDRQYSLLIQILERENFTTTAIMIKDLVNKNGKLEVFNELGN